MNKKISLILFLVFQLFTFSVESSSVNNQAPAINPETIPAETAAVVQTVPSGDIVNEIVDSREIFQEKDLEEIKVPEMKNEDISRKILELETNSVIYKEKIEQLEKNLQEKNQMVEELSNKVEKLIIITNALDDTTKSFTTKTLTHINEKIYKTGILIITILAGITLILGSLVLLQTNKNKKMIEEWKEFFELNIDALKREKKDKALNIENENEGEL